MIEPGQIYRYEALYYEVLALHDTFAWVNMFSALTPIGCEEPYTVTIASFEEFTLIDSIQAEVKNLRKDAAREYLDTIKRINERFNVTEEELAKILVDPIQAAKEAV